MLRELSGACTLLCCQACGAVIYQSTVVWLLYTHKPQHFLNVCNFHFGNIPSWIIVITVENYYPRGKMVLRFLVIVFVGWFFCWVLMFVIKAGGHRELLVIHVIVCVGSCFVFLCALHGSDAH